MIPYLIMYTVLLLTDKFLTNLSVNEQLSIFFFNSLFSFHNFWKNISHMCDKWALLQNKMWFGKFH